MITRPVPRFDSDEEADQWYNRDDLGWCERRRAYDAIEVIDVLLECHGLEIIVYDDGSDPHFEIVKREEVK